jgi:hypothetical protein
VTKKDDPMNRLYVAESGLTITGTMADHRLRLASSHMLAFAAALAGGSRATSLLQGLAQGLDVKPEWISECAADLIANKGECLVVAGLAPARTAVHAVVYAINEALGNIGTTVEIRLQHEARDDRDRRPGGAIGKKAVKTLVILGGNPVYNAPADLDWAELQKSGAEVVRWATTRRDLGGLAGHAHVAAAHYLESWGDARTATARSCRSSR